MRIRSVGIDLGKTTFHLVALGENGKVLLRKKFTAEAAHHFYRQDADFPGRDGGVFRSTLPRTCAARTRP